MRCPPRRVLFSQKTVENRKKSLDKRLEIDYIIRALRRQQVGLPINPAEDINIILIVFVPLRLLMQRFSL